MRRSADGFFLTVNAQSTRSGDANSSGINADRLAEQKTGSIRFRVQARKPFNHADRVTAVTDSDNLTLLMCSSYSASSIFEFATSSSSGEIQVDSRPSLNRANFLEEAPNKKILNGWRKTAASKDLIAVKGQVRSGFISRAADTTPKFIEIQLPENGNQRRLG
jgi:hypothetical protein